jgi:hypothetical protein
MMLMLDRITGYWPDRRQEGLGRLRVEKAVDPAEWFFKAHFFHGSGAARLARRRGSDASCCRRSTCCERGRRRGHEAPSVRARDDGARAVTWKYRGQVMPQNEVIRCEIDITEVGE